MRLQDKVAIVTGAASGMGAATARLFAREGAKVIVADMLEAEGQAVADSIKSNRGEARFQRLDVSSEKDWDAPSPPRSRPTARSTSSSTMPA